MEIEVGFALLLTTIAGLSTVIGSIIAYFIRQPGSSYLALILGFSTGVMVYISLDELLPLAHHYGREHQVILGIGAGMLVMAASLFVLS